MSNGNQLDLVELDQADDDDDEGGAFEPANKGKKFPAEPLTRDEVRALRLACNRRCPTGLRNASLLALLYRSGLRISEALDLRPIDFDRRGGTVRVLRGKGGKSRTVPIDAGAVAELEGWIERRAELDAGQTDPLFCTLAGRRMRTSYVRSNLLPRLAKRAGIARRVHAHSLRHTYAAELAREGKKVWEIQRLLGHASPNTTWHYLASLGVTADLVDVVRSRPDWTENS